MSETGRPTREQSLAIIAAQIDGPITVESVDGDDGKQRGLSQTERATSIQADVMFWGVVGRWSDDKHKGSGDPAAVLRAEIRRARSLPPDGLVPGHLCSRSRAVRAAVEQAGRAMWNNDARAMEHWTGVLRAFR